MLFKDISLVDENMNVREHMYLGTSGDAIAYIGDKMPDSPDIYGPAYAHSRGKLLIPGFVNAHSHASMYILRGYAENLSLMQWLQTKIFPFEAKMLPDDVYYSGLASVAEMLRFGVVSTTDMYMPGDVTCRVFAESGAKANVSHNVAWFGAESYFELPAYKIAMEMIKNYNGYDDGRIKTEFCLHAEYTTTQKIAREVAATAKEYKSSIHVHVSETANEVELCRQRHNGASPVRYLADCGVFDVPANAAHCVHIDDEDIAIFKEKNVNVASCPKSNLKLASGVCPAVRLLDAGVNVALGTDSVASNNNLNMLEEIKTFALLHKGINYKPTLLSPSQALYAGTRAGAIAQGREDCGLLKEGFKADIVAVDIDRPYMYPAHNLLNNLIYSSCGSDVFMTMVDGKILYEDGNYTTLDIDKLRYETDKSVKRILSELAVDA